MSVCGVVAVPAYPPRNQRNTTSDQGDRIRRTSRYNPSPSIIESQVRSLLEPETGSDNVQLTTDNLAREPKMLGKNLFYNTSGSTGTPKGQCSVMATLHNAAMTYRVMAHS